MSWGHPLSVKSVLSQRLTQAQPTFLRWNVNYDINMKELEPVLNWFASSEDRTLVIFNTSPFHSCIKLWIYRSVPGKSQYKKKKESNVYNL